MQNIDDSTSQIGPCAMSPTLKDLLDLSDETNKCAFELLFHDMFPIELTGTG